MTGSKRSESHLRSKHCEESLGNNRMVLEGLKLPDSELQPFDSPRTKYEAETLNAGGTNAGRTDSRKITNHVITATEMKPLPRHDPVKLPAKDWAVHIAFSGVRVRASRCFFRRWPERNSTSVLLTPWIIIQIIVNFLYFSFGPSRSLCAFRLVNQTAGEMLETSCNRRAVA